MCIGNYLNAIHLSAHQVTFCLSFASFATGSGMGAAAVFERGDGADELLLNARPPGSYNVFLSKDTR